MIHSLLVLIVIQLSFAQDQSTCTGPDAGNVVTCAEDIKEFKCDTNQAPICGGTVVNILKPLKDFLIKAEDDNIAIGTDFNIIFNTQVAPSEPIELIEGVIAGGDESLVGSTVSITNNQVGTLLEIKLLELNGDFSGDGLTLRLADGPNSGGIRLLETKCGDNGLACVSQESAVSEILEEATQNCKIITFNSDGLETGSYDCLSVYQGQTIISTAAAPPLPAARSDLVAELREELGSDDIEKKVTIQFSEAFTVNLWLMISLFALVNVGICYYRKSRSMVKSVNSSEKSVYVDDEDV